MIVKKTKQLGNFKRGINLYIPRRRSSSAPSGIVVATANAIVLSGITGAYSDLNGTYIKSGDPTNVTAGGVEGEATGAVFFNSAYTGGNKNGAAIWYGPILFGSGNGWQITWYDDNRFPLGSIVSADTTTVPISGYSNVAGYTGTITLALSSGIVAATAGNLVITFAYTINKSYTKYGVVPNAAWIYGEGDYAWALEWNPDGDNKWRLRNDYYEADPVVRAKSPAATSAIIPTDGWVYTEGSGPTVTITAA